MPWVILLILLVLAVLILAGPPLERIIDRIWPPDGVRPPRDADRPHQRRWPRCGHGVRWHRPELPTAMEQVPRPARAGAWWPATGAAGEFPADPGPRPYGPDGRGGHGDGMTSFDGTRTEPRLRPGGSRVLRYAAAGATALMSLMNLPFAIDDGGAGTPAPLAWLITLLGVAGLVAAIALLRGAGWAPWAVTAIGVVNLIGAAVALARDTEGAFIGLVLSAVITALGAALVRARAGRAG